MIWSSRGLAATSAQPVVVRVWRVYRGRTTMKGSILGFDGAGGAIRGEGGERYRFSAQDWSGPQPPRANDEVDFVAVGDTASEIYPLKSGQILNAAELGQALKRHAQAAEGALSRADGGAGAGPAVTRLLARPQVVLATVLVLASLLAGLCTVPSPDGLTSQPNLFAFPGNVGFARSQLAERKQQFAALSQAVDSTALGAFGGASAASSPDAGEKAALAKVNTALFVLGLAPAVFLAPLGALVLLVMEVQGRRLRLLEAALGVCAIGVLALTFSTRAAMADVIEAASLVSASAVTSRLHVGVGAWLIALCGVGLIATALGLLRRTPGLPGPAAA